jgi:DNA-binding transcriptional regulator YbjK
MMTTAILPELSEATAEGGFMAMFGSRKANGKTAGAALDALTAQLADGESASLVLVQSMKPDRFFNAAQQARLQRLMQAWRQTPEKPASAELLAAVDEELQATIERSKALMTRSE